MDYRRIASNYAAVAFVDASHFTNGGIKADGHIMLMRIDAEGAGVALNDVFTNVQNVFSASAGVTVTGPVAERTQWETMINGMMALLVGLIAVAVLIALVGVANTLSLSVIERTRESATLRAIGMTRGQLRRSLAVEALLLSLVSGVVGVVLGTLFGWLGSYMVFSCTATPCSRSNGPPTVWCSASPRSPLCWPAWLPPAEPSRRHPSRLWPRRRAISSLIRGSFVTPARYRTRRLRLVRGRGR